LGLEYNEFWYLFGAGQAYDIDCVFRRLSHSNKDQDDQRLIYGAGARKETVRRIKKLLKEFKAREMEIENAA
jgi:hypothetical protein